MRSVKTIIFAILFASAVLLLPAAQAQTYTVLHNFTGAQDGAFPQAGLTMAPTGSLYGTAYQGGEYGYGSVFQLRRSGSGWVFSPIYAFQGGNDGYWPYARVIAGPNGSLYGTTAEGGGGGCNLYGCGTVFNLQPPLATVCRNVLCGWTKTVLYRFTGFQDGYVPLGDLIFDQTGNLYGTASDGSFPSLGTVYKLTPSYGYWTEDTLHTFTEGSDGTGPNSGVVFDTAGNLYGTTSTGGGGCFGNLCGAVYELSPSGSGWTETILYAFQGGTDGQSPIGGVIFDPAGNLYGTTSTGGAGGGGTAFELSPSGNSWTFNLLSSFSGGYGAGPLASLTRDMAGNLYGTTAGAGTYQHGSVFRLTPSGGGWTETDLYDFTGGSDGGSPRSIVTLDANGNLYGTTYTGGAYDCGDEGCGVVWEITP